MGWQCIVKQTDFISRNKILPRRLRFESKKSVPGETTGLLSKEILSRKDEQGREGGKQISIGQLLNRGR